LRKNNLGLDLIDNMFNIKALSLKLYLYYYHNKLIKMMSQLPLESIRTQVRACIKCAADLPLGAKPIFQFHPAAKLLIVGQAPGTHAHHTGIPFNDASGERLRTWLEMDKDCFYDARKVAIIPMGLCYPGRLPQGGDSPPRPGCAPQWHNFFLNLLPHRQLTLLIGRYAQCYYLQDRIKKTVTETVYCWQDYLPTYFPLPHPSWRTKAWCRQNSWFEGMVLPELRQRIKQILSA
jgi:uracil-DNA glycosylase